ncbi:immunoglobulin-like domain-containing protein [Ihubacter sp. mB4P-1]|uniref:immunoglobulin-like domain-containing protein n=1 Tax=Ihubacter sp. mB4P-1 TaxID=3242370 RepID=UPI00137A01FD
MKKSTKIISILSVIIIIAAAVLLYRNALNDTWTESLTKESDFTPYLEFYPVDEEAIAAEKGAFIIHNKTDKEMRTGEFYALQKRVLGKWSDIGPSLDFVAVAYDVPPGEYSFTVNWETYFGELKPGVYRIIKECDLMTNESSHKYSEFLIWCEFKI